MSCPNSTAPIDISKSNLAGKCDLKCSYTFNYSNSSCVATNRGDYISVKHDSFSNPPVRYNGYNYNASEVRIYFPSLHTYNGQNSAGELIIVHQNDMGSNPLLVCVPIKKTDANTAGSAILSGIIDSVSSSATNENETVNVHLNDFTLSSIVPKKPYFSYTGSLPYQPCTGEVEYVVYAPLHGFCDITSDAYGKLTKVIKQHQYTIASTSKKLFIHDKAPAVSSEDEIYIDCKPVGQSEEETTLTTTTGGSSSTSYDEFSLDNLKKQGWFQIVVSIIIGLACILGFYAFIQVLSGSKLDFKKLAPQGTKGA